MQLEERNLVDCTLLLYARENTRGCQARLSLLKCFAGHPQISRSDSVKAIQRKRSCSGLRINSWAEPAAGFHSNPRTITTGDPADLRIRIPAAAAS